MASPPAERVRNAVRYNTGGPQPDAIAEYHLRTVLIGNGRMSIDEFEAGLEEALDKGWVERDADGKIRPRE